MEENKKVKDLTDSEKIVLMLEWMGFKKQSIGVYHHSQHMIGGIRVLDDLPPDDIAPLIYLNGQIAKAKKIREELLIKT